MNRFAIGQTFIMKYGVTFRFVTRQTGEVSMTIFVGAANEAASELTMGIIIGITSFILIAYLASFSVMKFRRFKVERAEFEKIKHLMKESEEVKQAFRAAEADRLFIEGREGVLPRNQ